MDFDKREAAFDAKYNKLLNAINNYKWVDEELKISEEQLNSTLAELFFLYITNYIPHLIMAQLDVDLDKEFDKCYQNVC